MRHLPLWGVLLALTAPAVAAELPATANPTHPVPSLNLPAALAGYRPLSAATPIDWSTANARVAALPSHHTGHEAPSHTGPQGGAHQSPTHHATDHAPPHRQATEVSISQFPEAHDHQHHGRRNEQPGQNHGHGAHHH